MRRLVAGTVVLAVVGALGVLSPGSPARAAMLPTLIRNDQIIRGNGLMNAMGPIASIASFDIRYA